MYTGETSDVTHHLSCKGVLCPTLLTFDLPVGAILDVDGRVGLQGCAQFTKVLAGVVTSEVASGSNVYRQ